MLRWYQGYGYYDDFLREHMPDVKLGEYQAVKEAKEYRDMYQAKLDRAKAGEEIESLNAEMYKMAINRADTVLENWHWEYQKACNRAGKEALEKEDYINAVLLTN